MAKKEAQTDLWVYNLLRDAGIELEPQGSIPLKKLMRHYAPPQSVAMVK